MQQTAMDAPPKRKSYVRQPRPQSEWVALKQRFDQKPRLGESGLPAGQGFLSYRGDPSLQETALTRNKYASRADNKMDLVLDACERLLTRTDCYALYIGFDSSELRTESILNPFCYEIHEVDALTADGYLEHHFAEVPFDAKMNAIDWIQRRISEGPVARFRHGGPATLSPRPQPRSWTLGSVDDIGNIVRDLRRLREGADYYLRNAAISLGQGIVRLTFNCDVTYVVPIRHFREFVASNF